MEKLDLKKTLRPLYSPPVGAFVAVTVPEMPFLKVDGDGDPNTAPAYRTAVEWLYGISYAMKFAAKARLERDYVVPPLEGLWSADDPESFVARRKDRWRWTMMILVPDFATRALFEDAVETTARKRAGRPPESLRLEPYAEGPSLQTMHLGSYDEESPVLAELHGVVMPERGLTFNGPHHEIYLSDPRRTAPSKLKTILRQPVAPRG
jgi:hypothetical protein